MTTEREAGGVTTSMQREAGLIPAEMNGKLDDEDQDTMKQKLLELQEQSLGPLKEDLADWIGKHLGIDITTDNFMNVLDNGVYVCQMAKLITQKAEECVKDGSYSEPLPSYKLRCKNNAPSGSWFARDNTANFLSWCKAYGMADDQMFETEYLVSHTDEKSVVICLLELARIGYKFGLEPPSLIKMEKEMEKEEPEPPKPPPPKLNSLDEEILRDGRVSVTDHESTDLSILHLSIESDHGFEESEDEEPIIEEVPPPKTWSLDEAVKRIAFLCKCHDHVKKLGEGKYLIFGKVVQIRFLKNRHLMVRVGGGWDTLEHYLIHHSPIQVFEHKRPYSASNGYHDDGNKYLCFKSRYKSTNY